MREAQKLKHVIGGVISCLEFGTHEGNVTELDDEMEKYSSFRCTGE